MSVTQSYPDVFPQPKAYPTQRPSTNSRYKATFRQNYFTAGDEEQFTTHLIKNPIQRQVEQLADIPEKFKGNSAESLMNTFRYMFYKFKKGILIQIRNGKVARFLPFSNAHYVNEWSSLVGHLPDELKESSTVLPIHRWYANNYLVRYESPQNEGDTGHAAIKNMFDDLCLERRIPDVDLFINRRDFPLLKKDGTEPYEEIFGPGRQLLSHSYPSYVPILSMVEDEEFADIPIPTPEDWARICAESLPPKYFMATKRTLDPFSDDAELNWDRKIGKAVFRGSATGKGIGDNNLRVKLCSLSDVEARIDAQICGGGHRYYIEKGSLVKQHSERAFNFLSRRQQSCFKYIINVSGHVRAHRLSAEFSYGSVILIVGGRYKLWFEKSIKEWVHYVPVKEDLSDLIQQIDWCEANDTECRKIALAARQFYEKYLSREAVLDYLETLTCNLSGHAVCGLIAKESYQPKLPLCTNMPVLTETRCLFNITNRAPETLSEHHSIVGRACVNSILKQIPGFAYTFFENRMEKLSRGNKFSDYLRGREFIFADWLGILKTISLALHVAQQTSRLTLHNLFPNNVFIYEETAIVSFDYLVDGNQIIRCSSQRIPILFNYSQSYAAAGGSVFQKCGGFEPFKDCLTILMSSSRELVKYQWLSRGEQTVLIDLFNNLFMDENTFTPISSFGQLEYFLKQHASDAALAFYPKTSILYKSPLDLYNKIENCSIGWKFEKVPYLENRHFGKIMHLARAPDVEKNPLLGRASLQQLWSIVVDKNRFPKEAPKLDFSSYYAPLLKYSREQVCRPIVKNYPELRQLIEQMIADGGRYKLSDDEKEEAQKLIITLLKNDE
jgi:Glycosyl transferase family 90